MDLSNAPRGFIGVGVCAQSSEFPHIQILGMTSCACCVVCSRRFFSIPGKEAEAQEEEEEVEDAGSGKSMQAGSAGDVCRGEMLEL